MKTNGVKGRSLAINHSSWLDIYVTPWWPIKRPTWGRGALYLFLLQEF